MKTTVYAGPGKVELKEVEKPTIQAEDDVILRIVRACVCGSDLWTYRSDDGDATVGQMNSGHEAIGVVEAVGSAITTVKEGDFVIAPFTHGCGRCAACRAGFEGCCQDHQDIWSNGYQAEYVRYQHGEWSLVKVSGKPEDYTEGMLASLLTLSDVMPTGYHAARVANVQPGDTVVVMGDGAVGLCGVISAKLCGASRIIAMSRHEDRQKLAIEFGATDIVAERGDEAVAKVMELTNGAGADAVLECVGTGQSSDTAIAVARPGAIVGRVGLPHDATLNPQGLFYRNTIIGGGPASVTTYDKAQLLDAVLKGEINPGKVFTSSYPLEQIDDAYQAMKNRETIKAMIVMD